MSTALFGENAAYAGRTVTPILAFDARIADAINRIKQELGVDELLLAVRDAKRIASTSVQNYLGAYSDAVVKAVKKADKDAQTKYTTMSGAFESAPKAVYDADTENTHLRSGKSVEKLVALTWKNTYEIEMEDVNAQMPLAQQIVSKYMSNFSAKPKLQ